MRVVKLIGDGKHYRVVTEAGRVVKLTYPLDTLYDIYDTDWREVTDKKLVKDIDYRPVTKEVRSFKALRYAVTNHILSTGMSSVRVPERFIMSYLRSKG